ncbi:ribosomal protein L11 methyltransferase [Companilactobacillus sp. RD055328]|uniref:50S ribosomal protein L11 methyltransferase n=1 Tax=Companilactobacillus sp. RD055328 TaxID=2916634 RepID=UPI001FC89F5A|nr:50S ribosomal protein L11 methyltransferase [Companilactobacillus sp. RD055328]GKQ42643.1 ribosomal protein L11 methyltransferase [Companilactobacillus sp. RD055328]
MKWTKIEVRITKKELEEIVSTVLMNNNAGGIEINDENTNEVILTTYFDHVNISDELILKIKQDVLDYREFGFEISDSDVLVTKSVIDDDNWKNEWQKYYHPTKISRYLTVAPEWESNIELREDENLVIMNPGESFGTGTHATTFTCLQALEIIIDRQQSMFDVGTGSGILSVAARKMGINNIEAFDIDQVAVDATKYNFSLNKDCNDIPVKKNSLLDGINKKVDIIVANILAEILFDFIPKMDKNLNVNGTIILSGIINEKEERITEELKNINYVVVSVIKKDGWSTIITKRKEDIEN